VPLLYVLIALPYGDGRQAFGEIWPILLHIQNYIPTPLGHMWSLAVEEHFYVLLPLLIALVGRRDGREAVPRLLVVVAALILLVSLARIVSVMSGGVDPRTARLLTHLRIDTLLTGVFLALLYHFRQEIWNRLLAVPKTMVVIAILAAWPFVLNPNTSRVFAAFGYSSLFVLYGAVLILTASLARMSTRHWFAPPLRGLALVGRYSYPIYLFHPFIWHAFRQIGVADPVHPLLLGNSESATWIVGLVAFAAVSIAVGIAFGYAVERPLLYMRNLILPPRALSLERDVEVVTGPA
jgi:peptidoglycan/LPS O-acetylase OafA/YrhL